MSAKNPNSANQPITDRDTQHYLDVYEQAARAAAEGTKFTPPKRDPLARQATIDARGESPFINEQLDVAAASPRHRRLGRRAVRGIAMATGLSLGAGVLAAGVSLLPHGSAANHNPDKKAAAAAPALKAIGTHRFNNPHIEHGSVKNLKDGRVELTVDLPLSAQAKKYEAPNMGFGPGKVNWNATPDVVTGVIKPGAHGKTTRASFTAGFDGTLDPATYDSYTGLAAMGVRNGEAVLTFTPNPADPEGTKVAIGAGEEANVEYVSQDGRRIDGVQEVGVIQKEGGKWVAVAPQPGEPNLSELPVVTNSRPHLPS